MISHRDTYVCKTCREYRGNRGMLTIEKHTQREAWGILTFAEYTKHSGKPREYLRPQNIRYSLFKLRLDFWEPPPWLGLWAEYWEESAHAPVHGWLGLVFFCVWFQSFIYISYFVFIMWSLATLPPPPARPLLFSDLIHTDNIRHFELLCLVF